MPSISVIATFQPRVFACEAPGDGRLECSIEKLTQRSGKDPTIERFGVAQRNHRSMVFPTTLPYKSEFSSLRRKRSSPSNLIAAECEHTPPALIALPAYCACEFDGNSTSGRPAIAHALQSKPEGRRSRRWTELPIQDIGLG